MATKRGPLFQEKAPYKNIIRRKPKPDSKNMLYIEDVVHLRFLRRSKSLLDAYPLVAQEWEYKKNCGWGPEHFTECSKVSAWWKCHLCNFVWQAKISNRTRNHSECPQCFLGETTNLRDYPEVFAQFDHKRNPKVNPYRLPKHLPVYWKCETSKDHKWKANFYRNEDNFCPYCRGVVASSTNNLSKKPKFAKQFHPTQNGNLTPKDVTLGTHKRVWWKCDKGSDHVWNASVKARIQQDQGCPFCTNQRVCKTNSLAFRFPAVAKEWHPKRNILKKAKTIVATSDYHAWWKCKACAHEWQARVVDRTKQGTGCPACKGRVVTKANNLAAQFPDIAREWHPVKNGSITAKQVLPGSHKKYWFKCKLCKFEWEAAVQNRTRQGQGCPKCGKAKLKLPRNRATSENNLQKRFPAIAKEWHPKLNGVLTAKDVHAGSNKKYWFLCKKCKYEWETRIENRTRKGATCPSCRIRIGKKKL